MSLCLLHAVGQDALIGHAFPREHRELHEKSPADVREYYRQKSIDEPATPEDVRDMNPDGFWECRYSVNGIKWHPNFPNLSGKYGKIVSQGIAQSNPEYIGKIVCMARDPRQVAKSQERLKRPNMPEGTVIHSPEMFVRVTVMLARWIIANNKAADVVIVNYDDLITDPTTQLRRVADFLSLPPEAFDPSLVKPQLQRSKPEPLAHHLWEAADAIFAALKTGNWQGIIDANQEHSAIIRRDKLSTNCERLDERMYYAECANCIHNASTRKAFKKRATAKGIDWRNKPCMFLCHTAPDIDRVPLRQTIEENHWIADGDDFIPPKITERAAMALGTLGRVIAAAATGKKVVARRDVIDARRAACDACPLMQKGRCRACSCEVKAKTRVAQSTCPKNRWPQ